LIGQELRMGSYLQCQKSDLAVYLRAEERVTTKN
jgi:hypothetical protein